MMQQAADGRSKDVTPLLLYQKIYKKSTETLRAWQVRKVMQYNLCSLLLLNEK
jgi:hypothetical protein